MIFPKLFDGSLAFKFGCMVTMDRISDVSHFIFKVTEQYLKCENIVSGGVGDHQKRLLLALHLLWLLQRILSRGDKKWLQLR